MSNNKNTTTEKRDIFFTGTLLGGAEFTILMGYGKDVSQAMKLTNTHPDIDIVLALMHILVRIGGQQMAVSYYEKMMIDDYMRVSNALGQLMNNPL
jgi:hypothetical protein